MKALKLRNQGDDLTFRVYDGIIIVDIKTPDMWGSLSYELPEKQIPKIIEWLKRSSIVSTPLRGEK